VWPFGSVRLVATIPHVSRPRSGLVFVRAPTSQRSTTYAWLAFHLRDDIDADADALSHSLQLRAGVVPPFPPQVWFAEEGPSSANFKVVSYTPNFLKKAGSAWTGMTDRPTWPTNAGAAPALTRSFSGLTMSVAHYAPTTPAHAKKLPMPTPRNAHSRNGHRATHHPHS
jgi:hypothetical protein